MKSPFPRYPVAFLLGFVATLGAMAAGEPPKGAAPNQAEFTGEAVQPLKPEEPMPIGMSKEGMTKGDVMEGAKKKREYMDAMMEEEEEEEEEEGGADKRGR